MAKYFRGYVIKSADYTRFYTCSSEYPYRFQTYTEGSNSTEDTSSYGGNTNGSSFYDFSPAFVNSTIVDPREY